MRFLCPNETELEILTGMPVDTYDHIRAARSLVDKGLNNIIVTMGEKGALWMTRDRSPCSGVSSERCRYQRAGDAFIGCFAHYYVRAGCGSRHEKAVLFALSASPERHPILLSSIEQFNEYLSLNE